MRAPVAMLLFMSIGVCSAAEFDEPWKNPEVAIVLDPFAGNSIDWDKLRSEPRVIAVIHKSTIGSSRIDPKYFTRKTEARQRGYLWGSYHWGEKGNPERQADFYFDSVRPAADELVALDLEDATSTTLMNAEEALRFVRRFKERSGRYLVLYTNHASSKLLSERFRNTEFANTPLWYARFKKKVTDFPRGLWQSYSLWQFSSEILPQMPIPGIKTDMDINVYNGTPQDLRSKWPLTVVMQ
jgi:lysozyme